MRENSKKNKEIQVILGAIKSKANFLRDYPDDSVSTTAIEIIADVEQALNKMFRVTLMLATSLILVILGLGALLYIFLATPNVEKPSISEVVTSAVKINDSVQLDVNQNKKDSTVYNDKLYDALNKNLALEDSLQIANLKVKWLSDFANAKISTKIKNGNVSYTIRAKRSKDHKTREMEEFFEKYESQDYKGIDKKDSTKQ